MFCPNCGLQVNSQAKFCSSCGKKLPIDTPKPATQQPIESAQILVKTSNSDLATNIKRAKNAIKSAVIAGIFCGVLTLIATLYSKIGAAGIDFMGFDLWNILDVTLIFSLTFGVYKKSRACALIMFLYFIGSKILMWVDTGKATGWWMAIIFAYFFFQGILGTFAYRKIANAGEKIDIAQQ
ncbi:MAG TPA: zinc ribbon domain-containing protein [archaeon]|nr:zinc ribbon domain-containing protein [archaeon]